MKTFLFKISLTLIVFLLVGSCTKDNPVTTGLQPDLNTEVSLRQGTISVQPLEYDFGGVVVNELGCN